MKLLQGNGVKLVEAERISQYVTNLIASKPRDGFCRASHLHGHSLCEISNAFALVLAKRRHIAGDDPSSRNQCREFADKAGGLVPALRMAVIPDADAEQLGRLARESFEWKRAFSDLISKQLDDRDPEWQRFLKLEALDSFNNYCWTLNPSDPLYWQKVYTHLDLPYDETFSVRGV